MSWTVAGGMVGRGTLSPYNWRLAGAWEWIMVGGRIVNDEQMPVHESSFYAAPMILSDSVRKRFSSFPGRSVGKNRPAVQDTQETRVHSLGGEDPLEKGMATQSSILAWRIPWTEEPGRLQSIVAEPTETTEHTALTVRTKTTRWSRQKNNYFPHSTSRDVDDSYANLRKMALELLRWHELHGPSSVPRILHKSPLTNGMRYIHTFCMGPLFKSKFSSVFTVGKRLRETLVDQSQNKRGLLPCSCQI